MNRRGSVLLVVLVLMALAGMIAAGLLYSVRAEVAAGSAVARGESAYAACQSGLATAILVLQQSRNDPTIWQDNPDLFRDRLACTDGSESWYFTVYAENPIDPSTPRYGVTDENGKINIAVADREQLLLLPNMTEELADCLLDYIDKDDEPRPAGAEQDYYSGLPYPYIIKNGAPATLEELLLVKGFTAAVVYGEDANMNGMLDANENDGDEHFPPDNADGQLDTGLRGLCTTFSYEVNVDSQGRPRLDLNNTPPAALAAVQLPPATIQFIKLYRDEGNTFKHPSDLLDMRYTLQKNHPDVPTARAGTQITSGVGRQQLATVLDRLTVASGTGAAAAIRVGALNATTASAKALACLPGIDENLATQIVEARASLDASAAATPAWLYTQGLVDAATFKRVAPRLGSRSNQFRIRVLGYGVPSGRFRTIEAVVDFGGGSPRVVYHRDITRLGLPLAAGTPSP
jgi:DNA uptake protein ComE-like DNA-binding protein